MNIRIELLTLQTSADKLSAAEFYAKFMAIADEFIRLQNLQQTEMLVADELKQFAHWMIVQNWGMFLSADIPKESKKKILNKLGYSSNSLDD